MIKIPVNCEVSGDLAAVYDQEFFRMHECNLSAFRELARLIDEVNGVRHDRSVLDVGCGHGFLVESLRERGYTESFGLEGSSSAQAIWPEKFRSFYTVQDLTVDSALAAARKTDLVCSFETGEHLDERYAGQYVRLLTQYSPRRVFFSAATKYQDCEMNPTHVNEQPFSYWIGLFRQQKYELDIVKTVEVRNSMFSSAAIFSSAWWYPKNILIFQPETAQNSEVDNRIAALYGSEIKWFENWTAPNRLFAMCLVRDRLEYNYLIMDAVAQAFMRQSKSR